MQSLSTTADRRRSRAYCNSTFDLTREHIFPGFIDKHDAAHGRSEPVSNVKVEGRDKAVQAALTINDVCRKCNNGFLSDLDSYGAQLYNKFFAMSPCPGEKVSFTFDYDMLLRWLLKLAYNAGRSRAWPPNLLQPLKDVVPYIKGESSRPTSLKLCLQLIIAARLSEEQKRIIERRTGSRMDEVPPEFRRINVFVYKGFSAGFRIAMNGYYFYLLFRDPECTASEYRRLEKQFCAGIKGIKSLDPATARTIIYPSSVSILDLAEEEHLFRTSFAATSWWEVQKKNRRKPHMR